MIHTRSAFYMVDPITLMNSYIDIDEGSGEENVQLDIGSWTIEELRNVAQNGLNSVLTQTYSILIARATRIATISAPAPFDLLLGSGVHAANNALQLLGFTGGVDLTGFNTYTAPSPTGFEYLPQFKLQSYVEPDNFERAASATVNKAANGSVEVVSFGTERFYEMNIRFITSKPMDGRVIRNNPNGLADAQRFLKFIRQKNRFEFIPDEGDRSIFSKVLLESIPGSEQGTGYKLRELFDQNLPDIYETGVFQLRVVT